jgi:hypothetical protein
MKVAHSDTSCTFGALADDLSKDLVSFSLSNVTITGNGDDLYGMWRVLRGHPTLEEFSMTNVKFEDIEADISLLISVLFVSCSCLKRVKLSNVPVPIEAVLAAKFCGTLEEICLSRDHFSDDDAAEIAKVLKCIPSIQKVDFSGNDLSENGCKSFEALLHLNKSIQTICLDDNDQTHPKPTSIIRNKSATAA